MATYEFKLPDIGEGVVEGEIVKWLVKAGDVITEDQPLVEVMTDKATVTIPSPKQGKVTRTVGKEGEIAKVHHVLVELEISGDGGAKPSNGQVAAAKASAPRPVVATAALPAPVTSGQKVLATPVTRRMAREHGLDLASISGTGPQGRVLKTDVEARLREGAPVTASSNGAVARPAQNWVPLQSAKGDERIPIRGLRKRIAEKMVKSKFTAPHYAFVEEIDVSAIVEVRNRLNAQLAKDQEIDKISFLPFFCKALVAAFKKFPSVNSNMDEAQQELIVRGEYNIGIAAMTAQGLTVPVVKNVDRLSVRALGTEISRLATAAREQKLKVEELTGGTFTITSLGQQGGLFATPIINHPETAIMGVHKMRKRPVVTDDDQIVIRQMCLFSFCFDHRVIDGALGAQFAYEFLKYIEQPDLLFLELA